MRTVVASLGLWSDGHRQRRCQAFSCAAVLAIVLGMLCEPERIWAQNTPPPLLCPGGAATNPEPEWLKDVVRPKAQGITQPMLIKSAKPRYPMEAMDAKVTGDVWLDAVVGVDGRVSQMCVVKSIPLLDAQAVEAAKQFEFRPAQKDGVAVPILVQIQIAFNLRENEKK